jgi:hypothetical protein
MSDAKPFNFADFVPGFDFLKNLATGSASAGAPGLPGLAKWVAPTLSVEEVEKRIQELKTVQFWLEQNLNALKATIQALEVQKMTLSTLRGMNLRMEDLTNSFTRAANAASAASPAPAPAPAPKPSFSFAPAPAPAPVAPPPAEPEVEAEAAPEPEAGPKGKGKAAATADTAGVIDPLQWWGALTQQFEQIASSALRDAASLRMPSTLQSAVEQASGAVKKTVAVANGKRPAAAAKKKAAARKPAAKRAPATAKRAAPRKR